MGNHMDRFLHLEFPEDDEKRNQKPQVSWKSGRAPRPVVRDTFADYVTSTGQTVSLQVPYVPERDENGNVILPGFGEPADTPGEAF